MTKIVVHGGSFDPSYVGAFKYNRFLLKPLDQMGPVTLTLQDLEMIETASEEAVKKLGGTFVWGVAGAVLAGPLGALTGLLVGGRKTEVTFLAGFADGRKLVATIDRHAYVQMQGAVATKNAGGTAPAPTGQFFSITMAESVKQALDQAVERSEAGRMASAIVKVTASKQAPDTESSAQVVRPSVPRFGKRTSA